MFFFRLKIVINCIFYFLISIFRFAKQIAYFVTFFKFILLHYMLSFKVMYPENSLSCSASLPVSPCRDAKSPYATSLTCSTGASLSAAACRLFADLSAGLLGVLGLLCQVSPENQKQENPHRKPTFSHLCGFVHGAGYGTRTRRLLLGKQSLYRMS